jgi:predicted nucleic acid binding AN1-type Zn finger protein
MIFYNIIFMHCKICNKTLDLAQQIIGKCRCNLYFCSTHRFPTKHNCSINVKKENSESLRKKNPLVLADKIVRI